MAKVTKGSRAVGPLARDAWASVEIMEKGDWAVCSSKMIFTVHPHRKAFERKYVKLLPPHAIGTPNSATSTSTCDRLGNKAIRSPGRNLEEGADRRVREGRKGMAPRKRDPVRAKARLVIPNRVKGDSLFGLGLRSESRRWPGKRGVDQDTARCFATISGARGALSRRPADFCERKRLEGQHSRRGISLPDAPRGRLRSIESPSPARDRQAPRNTSRPG